MAIEDDQASYEAEYNKAFYGDDDIATDDTVAVDSEPEQEDDNDANTDDILDDTDVVDSDEGDNDTAEPTTVADAVKLSKLLKVKVDGKEIEMEFSDEELASGMQKSFDYTRKTQAIAGDRKVIDKLKDLGINTDELEVLARAKGGDKDALAYLARNAGVDPIDLIDADSNNVRLETNDDYIVPSQQVQDILNSLKQDKELSAKLENAETLLPRSIMKLAATDANVLHALITEVRSGDFEAIQPYLQKELSVMSDFDRTFIQSSTEAYTNFYNNVKNTMTNRSQPPMREQPASSTQAPQVKPNMAEVGIRKSGASSGRDSSEDMDAFSSDAVYQKMLDSLNRFK